jgi:parallel beta-helix repeat protein
MMVVAFKIQTVNAYTTIIINADGSISPPTAPISTVDNVTYTFTGNISYPTYYGIVVERSNIIIDGNGYTVQGNQSGNGLFSMSPNNVTIKNANFKNFEYGICLTYPIIMHMSTYLGPPILVPAPNNAVIGNNITNNYYGVYFGYSSVYNSISGNNITDNTYGIYLDSSSNASISGNNITANNDDGIGLFSSSSSFIGGNNITTNKNDGIYLDSSSSNSISGNNITDISGNNITDNGDGIYLYSSSNYNSISGNNITANTYDGIAFYSCSNYNGISGNNITANNNDGIFLETSSNNSISENNVTNNNYSGIYLYSSFSNTISGDNIANNEWGIWLDSSNSSSINGNTFTANGLYVYDSYQDFVVNNIVNGKPLVYLEGVADWSVSNAGQVILVNCNNITVENFILSSASVGLELWETNNSIISGNVITANNYGGIILYSSSSNSISGNNITANNNDGIWLDSSSGNILSGNNITNNGDGIDLYSSPGNIISGSNITNNGGGIEFYSSSSNIISGNNITANNYEGILLDYSFNNSINGNDIANNLDGIFVVSSSSNNIIGNNITNNGHSGILVVSETSNNEIYHNNFIYNARQAVIGTNSTNVWDDGYPSGGNYWSDYNGIDVYSGPYQNQSGSDGIGDTAYVIDANNTDNYPLMQPYPTHNVAVNTLTVAPTMVCQGYGCLISVTVADKGDFAETFNVTIYANFTATGNVTAIATFENVTFNGRGLRLQLFMWDTSDFALGNYIISAYATPVPGETNIADNTLVDGTVQIIQASGGSGSRMPYMN